MSGVGAMLHMPIKFKQTKTNAVLLVSIVTLVIWFVFNLCIDAYPSQVSNYQSTPPATTTVVEPLDYHYTTQP